MAFPISQVDHQKNSPLEILILNPRAMVFRKGRFSGGKDKHAWYGVMLEGFLLKKTIQNNKKHL